MRRPEKVRFEPSSRHRHLRVQAVVDCKADAAACSKRQGYGLGYNVLDCGGVTVLEHSGADWSEVSLAYIERPSRSGVILFLNAPNRRALAAMPELIA